MTKHSTVISFESVTKRFGKFAAVDDVSFDVMPGEIVGFVGVNGAGKTTTINMLLGFTSPSKGKVSVFSEQITTANAFKSHRRIGYAAGDMELPTHLTGQQYLDFIMAQSSGSHSKQLSALISRFKPQLTKSIGNLSRGNKQKIALVAAFATSPDLIVLDEPTSGLDPIMQDVFLELVQREQTKGTTIFMSSHYLQEVAEVCSRVLLMKNGKIVEDLSADQLAKTGGKMVRIVSSGVIALPKQHIKQVEHEHHSKNLVTSFVYDGPAESLVKWLGGLKGVVDIEINERTLEAEFRSLYDDTQQGEQS